MSKDIFSFSAVTSTNDVTKKLLENRSNVIVTTKLQFKGRGRNNKRWEGDDEKNIYLSVGIEHKKESKEMSLLMLSYQCIGCLAVIQALEKIDSSLKLCLKYPNDVYAKPINGEFKKIAGVLVENEFLGNQLKSTILGVGVNIHQQYFEENIVATSLFLLGVIVDKDNLLRDIISEIERIENQPIKHIVELWKEVLKIEGKKVIIVGQQGVWEIVGYNEFSMVIVKQNDVMKVISDGESIRYELD